MWFAEGTCVVASHGRQGNPPRSTRALRPNAPDASACWASGGILSRQASMQRYHLFSSFVTPFLLDLPPEVECLGAGSPRGARLHGAAHTLFPKCNTPLRAQRVVRTQHHSQQPYLEGRGVDVAHVAVHLGVDAEIPAGPGLRGGNVLLEHLPTTKRHGTLLFPASCRDSLSALPRRPRGVAAQAATEIAPAAAHDHSPPERHAPDIVWQGLGSAMSVLSDCTAARAPQPYTADMLKSQVWQPFPSKRLESRLQTKIGSVFG